MFKIANKYLVLTVLLFAGCGATMSPLPSSTEKEKVEAKIASNPIDLKHLQSLDLGLADIPVAQAYLNKLIVRIQAAGSQPPRFVQVVIRPKLSYNAATTHSGIIIIDIGWLQNIDSEAELVALLSHEYAHIMLDHLQDRNTVGGSLEMLTKIYLGRASGNNDWAVSLIGESWTSLLNPNWSRKQELQADEFAFEMTQKMGYSSIASVRAFLDRIQSVEKLASKAMPLQNPLPLAVTDSHPKIEDRIAHVNKLMEGRPRLRPTLKATDEWRVIRESAIFKEQQKELVLANSVLDAIKMGKKSTLPILLKQLDALPRPYKTAGATTMLAYVQPDVSRRVAYLQQAIAAADASFLSYGLLATTQRDQLSQFETASNTLQEGLERFDSPHQHWPDVIDFHRSTMEKIDALPREQKDVSLSLYGFKLKAKILQLQAKCQLQAEVTQACNWAAMNAQQKQTAMSDMKEKESKMADQMLNKLKLKK